MRGINNLSLITKNILTKATNQYTNQREIKDAVEQPYVLKDS